MAEVKIDVKRLNGAFTKAFAQKRNELGPKAEQSREAMGLAGLGAIDEAVDTFCEAWPKVKPFIGFAMRGLGFFFPTQVSMVRAVISAIDEELIPNICGPGT